MKPNDKPNDKRGGGAAPVCVPARKPRPQHPTTDGLWVLWELALRLRIAYPMLEAMTPGQANDLGAVPSLRLRQRMIL